MSLIVRAFPLRAHPRDLEAFATALRERKAEADAFYRQYGVSHESWHVQETPEGNWVIAVTAVDDAAQAAVRYAGSSAAFDSWFKKQVLALTGIDVCVQPLGPPTTQVFVWEDDGRSHGELQARA